MEKSVATISEKVSNHITNDLVFSLLSKLPLKSLKRFGCVQKSWALLFENPDFMSIYRKNFISNNHSYYDHTSLVLQQTVENLHNSHSTLYLLSGERFENRVKLNLPLPFQELNQDIVILGSGSINGTLCLSSLYYNERIVVLWNPATEEFKVVPPSPYESTPYQIAGVNLHGFGYDHVRDDYMVIRHVKCFRLTPYNTQNLGHPCEDLYYAPLWEIYSLKSNSWRKLDVDMPMAPYRSVEGVQVYMDGICHWLGGTEIHSNKAYLVSFDLSNEVFFTTLMPSDMDDSLDFGFMQRHLTMLNGSIALISNYEEITTFHISILGEIGVKESWTKLFIVGPLHSVEHPIGAGKKGNIFFIKKDGELIWFDLSTQTIEQLGVKGATFCCQIVIYKESLLRIGGINN